MSYYPNQTHLVTPRQPQSSTAHLVIAWVVAVLTLSYMLPWAIAATRNRPNVVAIAMINLFLGWSLVGWVVALVMACSSDGQQSVLVVNNPQSYPYPPPPQFGHAPRYGRGPQFGPGQQQYPTPPALYDQVPESSHQEGLPAFHDPSFNPDPTYPEVTRPLPDWPNEAPPGHWRQ